MTLTTAIIGGGPSAFYLASRLLTSKLPSHVHMFEKLAVPYGLVRYGVAPDHQEVRNCIHKFEETAQDARFKFFGNVHVGTKVPMDFFKRYHQICIATGASEAVRTSETQTKGVISAMDFVNWYNGHPQQATGPELSQIESVVIIGMGNVALDCARILLKDAEALRGSDMPRHVFEMLQRSRVRKVIVVGRRGLLEAAFTTKEIRELVNLPVNLAIDESELARESEEKLIKRRTDVLRKAVQEKRGNMFEKSLGFQFWRTPNGYGLPLSVHWTAKEGQIPSTKTDLVIEAIGNRSTPIAGLPHLGGVVDNVEGRIVKGSSVVPGYYTTGWAARGPRGVIAASMFDAYSVADIMLADAQKGVFNQAEERELEVEAELRHLGVDVVGWNNWIS